MFFKLCNWYTIECGCVFIPYTSAEEKHRYIMNSDYLTSPWKFTKYRMEIDKRRERSFLPEILVLVTVSVRNLLRVIKRNLCAQ
jgi:hypothetical protein